MTDEEKKVRIEALLTERRGYELYGTPDMVAGVDAELKALGHKGKAPSKRATDRKQKQGTTR